MLSCHRPPRYHAGSFGARWIIAPPVSTGIASAKMPCGPSTLLMMSCIGQMPQRLRPVDRRQLLREVERLRRADQILLRRVRREHRPHLVLLAVEPGDEQHLHRAAAIPVALLVVRADAADAGAEALHVHRRERRIALRRDGHLPFGGRRAAGRADLAVRPRLLRHPVDRVVAVGERRAEDVVVAFGEEVAALVLLDVGVAALDRGRARAVMSRGTPLRTSQKLKLYGVRTKIDRVLLRRVLRAVDVGRPSACRRASASSPCARRWRSTPVPSRSHCAQR